MNGTVQYKSVPKAAKRIKRRMESRANRSFVRWPSFVIQFKEARGSDYHSSIKGEGSFHHQTTLPCFRGKFLQGDTSGRGPGLG